MREEKVFTIGQLLTYRQDGAVVDKHGTIQDNTELINKLANYYTEYEADYVEGAVETVFTTDVNMLEYAQEDRTKESVIKSLHMSFNFRGIFNTGKLIGTVLEGHGYGYDNVAYYETYIDGNKVYYAVGTYGDSGVVIRVLRVVAVGRVNEFKDTI